MDHVRWLQGLATPEVLSVLTMLGLGWTGWKLTSKVGSVALAGVRGLFGKFPLIAMTSAIMFTGGVGLFGYGVGEAMSGPKAPVAVKKIDDESLLSLVEKCGSNQQALASTLEFIGRRDGITDPGTLLKSIKEAKAENSEAIVAALTFLQSESSAAQKPEEQQYVELVNQLQTAKPKSITTAQATGLAGFGFALALAGIVTFANRPQRAVV